MDKSEDKFTLATTNATASSTGNLTLTTGTLVANLEGNVTGTSDLVNVSDSSENTEFPVVFNDESNALLDDTGAFTYNPSTGGLNVNGNVDTRHYFGKSTIGISNLNNVAGFGYVSFHDKAKIGFKQTSVGATYIQAPNGQTVSLQIHNISKLTVMSNLIQLGNNNCPTQVLNTLNAVGAATFDNTVGITGALTVSGDIVDGTTANPANVFATTTGLTTLGGGPVNVGASGSATNVKGTFNVDEAATFDSTVGITPDIVSSVR